MLQWIGLALLILLSGLFSGAEAAFTSLSPLQVQELAQHHGRRGRLVARLKARPEILLSTILIGNNVVNIAAAVIATEITIGLFGHRMVGAMTGVLTLVVLIFGEVTPKQIAITHNAAFSLLTARFIDVLSYVLRPVVVAISTVSTLLTRMLGRRGGSAVSLRSILGMLTMAEALRVVKPYERQMVQSVFRLDDMTVRTIMTHRTAVFSLDRNCRIGEVLERIVERGFSRIPVYDEEPENVVGIVLMKDILRVLSRDDGAGTRLRDIMIEPMFVPQTMKAHELLSQFKAQTLNMAVVIDEYGGFAGVATHEDLIEEVFGEFYDEHERPGQEKITYLGSHRGYRIAAETPVTQVEDTIGIDLPEAEEDETFAGYLMKRLGDVAEEGDEVPFAHGKVVVEKVFGNRIVSCRYVSFPDKG